MSVLRYVPLGGVGEVGMNMWALDWEGEILIVDAGVMFPQEDMLGVDLVIPDIAYCLEKGRRVLGIFLTHGHEDHTGALPFVLRRLGLPPVYGTSLTLGLARPRLKEHKVLRETDLREVRVGDRVQLGPFQVETIRVCHSVPDAVALAIRTPVGTVLYTSDFKLDPTPLDGLPTDVARFGELGGEGVLLMLSDSTNAERPGMSGSERDLAEPFRAIFRSASGRIVVATFASNLQRIQHVIRLAAEAGRRVAVVGRSVQANVKTAQKLGFLEVPAQLLVRLETADRLPDREVVLLTAGSQGEPLSALARFAAQRHPLVNVKTGDTVVISATPIPGNERLVHRTINNLYRHGATVHYSEVSKVHVSGHAYQDELKRMATLVRPRFFIPVHGEYRQLKHHAVLAIDAGIDAEGTLIVEDGQTVELGLDSMCLGPNIGGGLVYVDGLGIGDVEQVVLRDRRRLAEDGVLVVTATVDRGTGALRAGPDVTSRGFIEPESERGLMEEAARAAARAIERASGGGEAEIVVLQEAVHDAVLALARTRTRRRPMVIPLINDI